MRKMGEIIAWILTMVLLCGQVPLQTFAQTSMPGQTVSGGDVSGGNTVQPNLANKISVMGENSFGNMLATEMAEEVSEQQENNGYNVFSVEIQENVALVELESVQDSVLVVGIYDEAGEELLTTGSVEVMAGETFVMVELNAESIPQYFYIRTYLIEDFSYRPLCTVYESPMYTQEMQELLAKTTADFEEERVLNLDEDEANNFAVFSEETILLSDENGQNDVVKADDTENVYVIEDADNTVTSLQPGDIFAYSYGENEVLIVKVASIEVDGTTVTITGSDTSMEEVFDYIKIDEEMGSGEAIVDASSCDDGITYEGLVDYVDEDTPQTYGIEVEGSSEAAFGMKVDKTCSENGSEGDSSVSISGGLEVKLKFSAKVYLSFSTQYIELKFDYSAKIFADVSGKISSEMPLITVAFIPVSGIIVELTPSFVLEADTSISIEGTLSGTIGLRAHAGEGITNLTSFPRFKSSIKVEGTIFLGFSLCPRVKILSDKVASASLTGKIGVEVKAALRDPLAVNMNEKHECNLCIDGEITGKIIVSANVKLLNKKTFGFAMPQLEIKIADFYYSAYKDSFGWSDCPFDLYRGKVKIVNGDDIPLQYVSVKLAANGNILTTNKDGVVEFWLPKGEQFVQISRTNYKTVDRVLLLEKGGECLQVKLEKVESGDTSGGTGEGGSDTGGGEEGTINEKEIVEVSLGSAYSAAITGTGDLYLWGHNYYGRLGDGTEYGAQSIPKKIMSEVKAVSLGDSHSAAITQAGDLYLWGNNDGGEIGDGTYEDSLMPKKIMSGVKAVSLGDSHSAAITENGELYLWGNNSYGKLGDGTYEHSTVPKKIMSGVKAVSLGASHSAAITEQGELYLWGKNRDGQIGDGTYDASLVPKKIMDGVKAVSLGESHSAAITEDGTAYFWGDNSSGILGDGTCITSSEPKKIMSGVKTVSLGNIHSAIITESDELYLWGLGALGQLGNGTVESSDEPQKIMSGVKSISLGDHHSAAITEGDALYLWGSNACGQLGDGTTTNSAVPIKIQIPPTEISEATNYLAILNPTVAAGVTYWNGTAFTNLRPSETYNYYVMQDRDVEEPFSNENLLYIAQANTDENGNLAVAFSEEVASAGEDIF
ncbi:MAG: fibronectin, partial [Lachnospiraceae bacterium]|nr:fibronectin [Lachnospiraceae bacterium]